MGKDGHLCFVTTARGRKGCDCIDYSSALLLHKVCRWMSAVLDQVTVKKVKLSRYRHAGDKGRGSVAPTYS
jgi:hypothetical protein